MKTSIIALCATTLSLLPACYGRNGLPEDAGVYGYTNVQSEEIHEVWEFSVNASYGCGFVGGLIDPADCDGTPTTAGSTCSLTVREYESSAGGFPDSNGHVWYGFNGGVDQPALATATAWLDAIRDAEAGGWTTDDSCVVRSRIVPQPAGLVSQFQYYTDLNCPITQINQGADPIAASNACASYREQEYVYRTVQVPQ